MILSNRVMQGRQITAPIKRMNAVKFFLVALLGCWCMTGNAADFAFSEDDCVRILERWASDPDSVPQRLVDDCKEALAAPGTPPADASPGEDTAPPALAGADPCVGPNAASSIYCWGPWAALAPAAAGDPGPITLADVDDYDTRPELADEFQTSLDDPPLDLPIEGCPPGTPCGFATVVEGTSGQGEAADTRFARFALAPDGTNFTVDPETGDDIASVQNMTTAFFDRTDAPENLRASGADGDERSRLIARVFRDQGGNIQTAADLWGHGNAASGIANSGFFAWGTTTSQVDVDALNNGGVSLAFAGPMSVDNSTSAALTINYGAQPNWSGNWTNPNYSFGAGGRVSGADFISSPDQFTNNITGTSNFVQGALLGEQDNQSIAHIIDVNVDGVGRIKDVGLLRQLDTPITLTGALP